MAGSGTAHLRAPEDSLLRVEHLVVEFPVGTEAGKDALARNLAAGATAAGTPVGGAGGAVVTSTVGG